MKFKKMITPNRAIFAVFVIGVLVYLWQAGIVDPKKPLESGRNVVNQVTSVFTGADGFSFDENTKGYDTYKVLLQGCPRKDCIPSIDNPEYESIASANEWLGDQDVIFALDYKGVQRGYAQKILNRHEIVNDVVASDPLAITFCPLCGSALAFDRTVNSEVTEFGVSGKLHNNDLIMYDRNTDSLWQQITGEAIVGELFGVRLKQVPLSGMRWTDFKEEFPNAEVLARAGAGRQYDAYPYGDYEQDPSPLFPMEYDQTIHPKTVVYGLEHEGEFKAYPQDKIKEEATIEDNLGGVAFKISYNGGDIEAINLETGEEAVLTRLFWFAWKAFRPGTDLY